MRISNCALLFCAAACASSQAAAVTTVYTASPAFLSNVATGSYLNTFTGPLTPVGAPSYIFSQGGFAYTITGQATESPNGTFQNGSVIGSNYGLASLLITINSGNVTAIGGDFFTGDTSVGSFIAAPVTITLSDGTTVSYTPSSLTTAFRGFTSTTPIASLLMSQQAGRVNVIDNLIVGSVVPEPGTYLLLSYGLLLIVSRARIRK